jgi:hypothetical protein
LLNAESDERIAMTEVVNVGRANSGSRDAEIDDLLLRIRGLVFVNAILEERGAGEEELEAHRRELERLRSRLVQLVLEEAKELGAAA